MVLRGTPQEIGFETGCLADNIDKAVASGRIEDLGKPWAVNTLIRKPVGRIALLYRCNGEGCGASSSEKYGWNTICSFGVSNIVDAQGNNVLDEFKWAESYAANITGSNGETPWCASRSHSSHTTEA